MGRGGSKWKLTLVCSVQIRSQCGLPVIVLLYGTDAQASCLDLTSSRGRSGSKAQQRIIPISRSETVILERGGNRKRKVQKGRVEPRSFRSVPALWLAISGGLHEKGMIVLLTTGSPRFIGGQTYMSWIRVVLLVLPSDGQLVGGDAWWCDIVLGLSNSFHGVDGLVSVIWCWLNVDKLVDSAEFLV